MYLFRFYPETWVLVVESAFSNKGINKTQQIGHCHLEHSYGMTLASYTKRYNKQF